MSRSAVREIQVSGISAQRGEILVPTQIGDAVHGLLGCPAAPLVAGLLRAKGRQTRLADLPRCDDDTADVDAVLYLATCQQQDGSTVAIAAGSAPGDPLSAAAARAAVEEWAAVCGNRTLLMAGGPWCSGALRAASAARQAAAEYGGTGRTVRVLAPVAIPAETASELSDLGAVIATTLAEVEPGDVLVLPAHGVTTDARAEAIRRGAIVIDATCPLVASAQTAANRAADRGQHLVLISQPGHAATTPIASHGPDHVTVVETPAATAAVRVSDTQHVTYLMQPGIVLEAGVPIVAALRSRYPAVKAAVPGEVCFAPTDRAGTVHSVALGSDLVLVLGDPNSVDARQVCSLARDSGTRAQMIAEAGDIRPAMLAGVNTIGLAESTSAQAGLAAQVTLALSGIGRLSVARRRLSTEKTAAAFA